MKLYFTKYLPVEGDIKIGDTFFTRHFRLGECVSEEQSVGLKEKDAKLAKLFLCSRDIQVGDKLTGWSNKTYHIAIEEDIELFKNAGVTDDIFKVIGEISPDAIWVKEGDEFEEEDLQGILYRLNHPDESIYGSIDQLLLLHKTITHPERYTPRVEIKCSQCNTFH